MAVLHARSTRPPKLNVLLASSFVLLCFMPRGSLEFASQAKCMIGAGLRTACRVKARHCFTRRCKGTDETVTAGLERGDIPDSPASLLMERRLRRWRGLQSSLDWTRYHLDVAFIEGAGSGDVRIAAGLFERIARSHSCAGALPLEVGTTGNLVPALGEKLAAELDIGTQWLDRNVEVFAADDLNHYDVVVCIDTTSLDSFQNALRVSGRDPFPPHVVELSDFGAYLEVRRPESPMKAWVPDWRAVIDPQYDERQASAVAPLDDALAVWKELPEDLAKLVQPHYEEVSSQVFDQEDPHDNFRSARIAFHTGGLVRFLMDTYPLDLHGGPGYCGPP